MEWASGNIFIRPNVLPNVGDSVDGHTHQFDHTSIVYTGSVHVTAILPDGRVIEQEFTAPAHFLVKAEVRHRIVATKPDTVFWCVYSHRDAQGDVVQEQAGWVYG